jgi:hypothetical protein
MKNMKGRNKRKAFTTETRRHREEDSEILRILSAGTQQIKFAGWSIWRGEKRRLFYVFSPVKVICRIYFAGLPAIQIRQISVVSSSACPE